MGSLQSLIVDPISLTESLVGTNQEPERGAVAVP